MTKFYLSFIFTWEDVLFYQNRINDFLSIYDAFILHYQHKVINAFISCKLKQDTSQDLILFW